MRTKNRPFPSCLVPLSQSESWCIAFHLQMSFHSHADKTHFHMKGFARGLALRKRHKTIRKYPTGANVRKSVSSKIKVAPYSFMTARALMM